MSAAAAISALRVVIDPQIFQIQHRGGVSRYFADLALELERRKDVDLVLPFRRIRSEHLALAFPGRFSTGSGSRLLTPRVLDMLERPRRRRADGADIVHHTWYRPASLETYRGDRRICTVHDMIPEEFPEVYEGRDPHHGKREHVDAADAIVCNSEATKADLIRHWGDPGKPVHVTHLAVSDAFYSPRSSTADLPEEFVLFVGRRAEYKNFAVLAAAFEQITSRRPDLHLVCVGGGPLEQDELEDLARRGVADRVHQIAVAEHDLPAVYARAACFVFPSLYEGFGLPVLEAFASGTPTIVSDTPSLVEVAGGCATVVPPREPDAVAVAIEALLDADPDQRSSVVDAARDRAREFTWRRTCEATMDLYATALAT